jgi:hypothetical protein
MRLSGLVPLESFREQAEELAALRAEVGQLRVLLADARAEADTAAALLLEQQEVGGREGRGPRSVLCQAAPTSCALDARRMGWRR